MKTLIIIDMQNDFLTGPLGNEHCRAAISEVISLIRSEEWDNIITTRDTHTDSYMNTLEGQKLPVPHCKYETAGWEVNSDIKNAIYDHESSHYFEVDKPTFGSFDIHKEIIKEYEFNYGQQATEMLGRGSDLEFHVCGVCTSICVLANVVILRATWPDAKIVVHANACGDVTKEMHEAAKICFASQQCEVVGE